MEVLENVNTKLSRKITAALVSKGVINQASAITLEKQLAEGKAKESDWIAAFTQKFNTTKIDDNEAK